MSEPVEVFVDNCIFSHSIRNSASVARRDQWLKEQIQAISQIVKLKKQGKIKVWFDLNVFFEGRKRGSSANKKIEQKWGRLKPGPTFVGFQGVMVNWSEKPKWKQRLAEVQKWLGDKSLDATHLVQAELYQTQFFITTDKALINKVKSKSQGFLRVKVLSPKEFMEILRQKFPDW